jgi:hypothetical protein
MCANATYKGKVASSQGELAKLLGDGDWKRGKAMMVFDADSSFHFSYCLCPVRHAETAAKVGCIDNYDGNLWHDYEPATETSSSPDS